jgi:hypothetical protein
MDNSRLNTFFALVRQAQHLATLPKNEGYVYLVRRPGEDWTTIEDEEEIKTLRYLDASCEGILTVSAQGEIGVHCDFSEGGENAP